MSHKGRHETLSQRCARALHKGVEGEEAVAAFAREHALEVGDEKLASLLDEADEFASFRNEIEFPKQEDGTARTYLCGNSLGLLPRATRKRVNDELDSWSALGVEGHFRGNMPWAKVDDFTDSPMSEIVGARPHEVVVTGTLSANLHALLVHFYSPSAERYKIITERKAFPSDRYALVSHIQRHGLDPNKCLIELEPRQGEHTLRDEDILNVIEEHGASTAIVMMAGLQYYTGQLFNMKEITAHAHKQGCTVGFDLAHAVGNAELALHEWDVDFACWCTYKYLNSGPGNIAGLFIHEKLHGSVQNRPILAGWWGHDRATRFAMPEEFVPDASARALAVSNPPILCCAALLSSLELFKRAGGVPSLRKKSVKLTVSPVVDNLPFYEYAHNVHWFERLGELVTIITPRESARRGCQLSLLFHGREPRAVLAALDKSGVTCDFREPNVIRVAPTPLYNSFRDVHNFVTILERTVHSA